MKLQLSAKEASNAVSTLPDGGTVGATSWLLSFPTRHTFHY